MKHIFLLVLFITSTTLLFGQTSDETMDDTASSCGYTSNEWGNAAGSISFLNNGNFNATPLTCNCTGTSSVDYSPNPQNHYQNNGAAQGMIPLFSDTLDWPYSFRWFCNTNNLVYYNLPNSPLFKGFCEFSFFNYNINDEPVYRYFLMELNTPMTEGTNFTCQATVVGKPTTDGQNVFIDQIGVALVNDLSGFSDVTNMASSVVPNFKTPAGIPIQTNSYTISFETIGHGEKYLVIGVFDEISQLNPTGTIGEVPSTYFIENVRIYRPDCPNEHVNLFHEEISDCIGALQYIQSTSGFEPYSWYVDDVLQTETTNTLDFILDTLSHDIRVACDTGICYTTDHLTISPHIFKFNWPSDTVISCDIPVHFNSNCTTEYMNYSQWIYKVDDINGNNLVPSHLIYGLLPDVSFTVFEPGTYICDLTSYETNCHFTDTIVVHETVPLLQDETNTDLLTYQIEHEHCINSFDGAIAFNPESYPLALEYLWNNELGETSFIDSLNTGVYSVYVIDSDARCDYYSIEILQLFDECNIIHGKVSYDEDRNCDSLATDINYVMQKVVAYPLGNFAYTDAEGNYEILVPEGDYNVTREFDTPIIATHCSSPTNISFSSFGSVADSINFLDTMHLSLPDVNFVMFSPIMALVVDHQVNYFIRIQNQGDTICSGRIKMLESNEEFTLTPYSENYVGTSGDTLIFEFNDLAPLEFLQIITLGYTYQNEANIGQIAEFEGWIELYDLVDLYPEGNYAYKEAEIFGSFDPNAKSVSPVGYTENHFISSEQERLLYTIQFQNTGNYPATNILLSDTLSPYLIPSSIQIEGYSHFMTPSFYDGELTFMFENIMLPDSTSNEPDSHGFVSYSIALQPNLPTNTEIENTAYIYFDNNSPIITNTTLNTIYDCAEFLPEFDLTIDENCPLSAIETTYNTDYIDSTNWYLDTELVGTDMTYSSELVNGTYNLLHEIYNETCGEKFAEQTIVIDYTFPLDLNNNGNQIIASTPMNALEFEWYINDVFYATTTSPVLNATESGNYSVIAHSSDGCEAISSHFTFIYNSSVEIDSSQIKIYPNPTKEKVFVELLESSIGTIELTDAFGRKILEIKIQDKTNQIDCSKLSPGTYFVSVYQNQTTFTEKLIIIQGE